jgi:hypothetical protein
VRIEPKAKSTTAACVSQAIAGLSNHGVRIEPKAKSTTAKIKAIDVVYTAKSDIHFGRIRLIHGA